MGTVLIIGSGPNAVNARQWDGSGFDSIVAINNAWAVRPDWTHHVFPDDFPEERRPEALAEGQVRVTSADYVPSNNRFGGIAYAGGTMAFTAAYWALDALKPDRLAFIGCDMMYAASGNTHFYGQGTADPLRPDPTLQSLEAKAARFQALAAGAGCAVINLSNAPSRLTFPRAMPDQMGRHSPIVPDRVAFGAALAAEKSAGLVFPSGKYWKEITDEDWATLARIDRLWRACYPG